MPRYEKTFSIGSEDAEGYQDCPHQDRVRLEKRIIIRKRAVILAIITIFSVTAIMLVTSVVIEEARQDIVYQEIVCQETDSLCVQSLCPQGWTWDKAREECKVMQGYSCCPPSQHVCGESLHTQCSPLGRAPACCDLHSLGLAPSAYKKMCQQGYIWVEWKRMCMRST